MNFFNHCFSVDNYDTLEYSQVKTTAVSVRLRIYLCSFKNTNKLSNTIAGKKNWRKDFDIELDVY